MNFHSLTCHLAPVCAQVPNRPGSSACPWPWNSGHHCKAHTLLWEQTPHTQFIEGQLRRAGKNFATSPSKQIRTQTPWPEGPNYIVPYPSLTRSRAGTKLDLRIQPPELREDKLLLIHPVCGLLFGSPYSVPHPTGFRENMFLLIPWFWTCEHQNWNYTLLHFYVIQIWGSY